MRGKGVKVILEIPHFLSGHRKIQPKDYFRQFYITIRTYNPLKSTKTVSIYSWIYFYDWYCIAIQFWIVTQC